MVELEAHSMRLFPKGQGAGAYRINGIASRCDLVILTDLEQPAVRLVANAAGPPRTVFLSLRSRFSALEYFHNEVLPELTREFVLVTGSVDMTLPRQTDRRWAPFTGEQVRLIENIRNSPRLLHWFAENLDESRPGMSPIPTGYVTEVTETLEALDVQDYPEISRRPLQALCCHRVRPGGQWEARRRVASLCQSELAALSKVVPEGLTLEAFRSEIRRLPFVLCVEGGGLDPSPKAWEALAQGSIPVIRRNPATAAYADLPVAFVDAWEPGFLDPGKMASWIRNYGACFSDRHLRAQVIHRLSVDYWWGRITAVLP